MSWSVGIIEVGTIPGIPLSAYLPDAPDSASIDPPCYCYVATDGSSTILVDTGPDRSTSAAAGLVINGDTAAQLAGGLRSAGIAPQDVDLIVHTHLHYDHMQNDLAFPRAQVVVQETELTWATSPQGGPFYVGVGELAAALGDRLAPIGGQSEILPGVTALPNGGHTPGHQSVLITTASGDVCVCGDIVSLHANLTTIGSVCPDVAATEVFLTRARRSAWEMIPSHEPELRSHRWYLRHAGSPAEAITSSRQGQGGHSGRCC